MRTVVAIIPVRAGSTRLKNKNIAPFAGSNLLVHKIRQLKEVAEVNKIIVSSDSDLMLSMAIDEKVGTHKRAAEYCDEVSRPFGEVVANICESVTGDDILWAPCVAPLCEPQDYSNAIKQYFAALEAGFDSLVSLEQFKRYVWDDRGPVNYRADIGHVKSQELPPLYYVTNAIYLAPREKMVEWKYLLGPKPYRYLLSKRASVDIDDALDLACAKAWLDMNQ